MASGECPPPPSYEAAVKYSNSKDTTITIQPYPSAPPFDEHSNSPNEHRTYRRDRRETGSNSSSSSSSSDSDLHQITVEQPHQNSMEAIDDELGLEDDDAYKESEGGCGLCISCICHSGFITCIVVIIVYELQGGMQGNLIIAPIVCGIFAYMSLLIEACCSTTMSYASNCKKAQEVRDYIRQIKQNPPVVSMHVECYHYETRTRRVSYQSGGRTHYRTETYKVKVTTHKESEYYKIDSWTDVSSDLGGLSADKPTRISLTKRYLFMDDSSRQAWNQQSDRFKARNRNIDKEMSYTEDFTIADFETHMMAYMTEKGKSCWYDPCVYFLCTLLLCNWIYRWCFRKNTAKTTYHVIKKIKVDTPE